MPSSLMTAAEDANAEELEKSLGQGGNPDAKNALGNPLLHIVLESKKSDEQINASLHVLIEHGANINIQNIEGQTLLHIAVEQNDLTVTNSLLDMDADVTLKDNEGNTSLHLAAAVIVAKRAYFEECPIIELLVNAVDTAVDDTELRNFINQTNNAGDTALHVLVKLDAFLLKNPAVNLLLNKGADAKKKNNEGITPFDTLLQAEFLTAATSLNIEKTRQALIKGAKPDAQDSEGKCAIHYVANFFEKEKEQEVIKMLVLLKEFKANINIQGGIHNLGRTALHWAVEWRYASVVKWLLENGAEVEVKDYSGMTPLHSAADIRSDGLKIMELLLKKIPEEKKVSAINAVDGFKNTPLIHAVLACKDDTEGNTDVIQYLLDNGADINVSNQSKSTALHYAASGVNDSLVNLLIKKGANVTAVDKKGRTPAGVAIKSNNDMIRDLLVGANEATTEKVKAIQQEPQKSSKSHPTLQFSSVLGGEPETTTNIEASDVDEPQPEKQHYHTK